MSETTRSVAEDCSDILDEYFGPKPDPTPPSSRRMQKIANNKWFQLAGVLGTLGTGLVGCSKPIKPPCSQAQKKDCADKTKATQDHNGNVITALQQFEKGYNLKHFGKESVDRQLTDEECDAFWKAYNEFREKNNLKLKTVVAGFCESRDNIPEGYSCGTIGNGEVTFSSVPLWFPHTCTFTQIPPLDEPSDEQPSTEWPDSGEPTADAGTVDTKIPEFNTDKTLEPPTPEPTKDARDAGQPPEPPSPEPQRDARDAGAPPEPPAPEPSKEPTPEKTQPEPQPDNKQPDKSVPKPQFIVKCDSSMHPQVHSKGHPAEKTTGLTHFEIDANVRTNQLQVATVEPSGLQHISKMQSIGQTTTGGLGITTSACDPMNTKQSYFAKLRAYIIGRITKPGNATTPREVQIPPISMRVMEHASDTEHPTICPRDINTAKCKPGQQPQKNTHPGFSGKLPDANGKPPKGMGKLATVCNQVWAAAAHCKTVTTCKIVGAWKKLTASWSSPIGRTYSEVRQARTPQTTLQDTTKTANGAVVEMRCQNKFTP